MSVIMDLIVPISWNINNVIFLIITIVCGVLVFLDARKSLKYSIIKSLIWGFVCFLLFPITPLIYLIIRFLNKKADKLGL